MPAMPVDKRELLEKLVDEHYQFLYRYAYRLSGSVHEAEDLTQETYCTAQLKLDRLIEVASSRAWLCRILRNHYLARARRPTVVPAGLLDGVQLPAESADRFEEWEIDQEKLQEALMMLPEPYRSTIVLHYMGEMSYREIAELLDTPIGTVMSRLSRAKRFLRAMLMEKRSTASTHATRP